MMQQPVSRPNDREHVFVGMRGKVRRDPGFERLVA